MRTSLIALPELVVVAVTRAALGAGIGLLVGRRLRSKQRVQLGWALVGFGVVTTIPLALRILRRFRAPAIRAPNSARPHTEAATTAE